MRLSKIGDVKCIFHRDVEGDIKRITVKKDNLGQWNAYLLCKIDKIDQQPNKNERIVGIDLGLSTFAYMSDGTFIDREKWFTELDDMVCSLSVKLKACSKGSADYKKYLRKIQHVHDKLRNKRKDFLHKVSNELLNRYDILIFEKLNVAGMVKSEQFLKHRILDACWSEFITIVKYKAIERNKTVIIVPSKNTTQMCSGCSSIVPKDLRERVHDCSSCGLKMNRDLNAAKNILRLGLQFLCENQ